MKTKQGRVCELSPFGENEPRRKARRSFEERPMPAYTTSEKANARLGERYAGTKKQIGILVLLLAGTVSLPLAAQPMAGMEAQKKTEQASHRGAGKVVSVDRAKSRIKLAHDPIKSLGWSAMLMDFDVINASLLDGLKEGDAVQFDLGKTKPDDLVWVIVKIKRR